VVLRITEPQPQFGRLIVADYLPAGFEIDNPNLVSSGDTGALDWIEDGAEPVHTEFRDDHFGAAFGALFSGLILLPMLGLSKVLIILCLTKTFSLSLWLFDLRKSS